MNLSGLRQIAAHWKEIRGTLSLLREGASRRSPTGQPSLWELRWAAMAGVALPAYVLCRGGSQPESGRLDPTFSGTSKILFDVITVADRLAEEALPRGELESLLQTPVDVDRFMRFAEESGAFMGPRGVCAAPDSMVREALMYLVSPGLGSPTLPESVERALGSREAFFRFAEAFFVMDIVCCSYQFVASDLAQSLVEALRELSEETLGSLGRRVLGALNSAIAALPDLDFVVLPGERRRQILDLHSYYLRRLGLSPLVSSLPTANESHTFLDGRELSPALRQLIEPVLIAAVQLEHHAARELPDFAEEVKTAIGWEEQEEFEHPVLLERLLGIGVARVLREACEASAAARAGESV